MKEQKTISISAPAARMMEEMSKKHAPQLLQAAEEISELLGKMPEEWLETD